MLSRGIEGSGLGLGKSGAGVGAGEGVTTIVRVVGFTTEGEVILLKTGISLGVRDVFAIGEDKECIWKVVDTYDIVEGG